MAFIGGRYSGQQIGTGKLLEASPDLWSTVWKGKYKVNISFHCILPTGVKVVFWSIDISTYDILILLFLCLCYLSLRSDYI